MARGNRERSAQSSAADKPLAFAATERLEVTSSTAGTTESTPKESDVASNDRQTIAATDPAPEHKSDGGSDARSTQEAPAVDPAPVTNAQDGAPHAQASTVQMTSDMPRLAEFIEEGLLPTKEQYAEAGYTPERYDAFVAERYLELIARVPPSAPSDAPSDAALVAEGGEGTVLSDETVTVELTPVATKSLPEPKRGHAWARIAGPRVYTHGVQRDGHAFERTWENGEVGMFAKADIDSLPTHFELL